MYKLKLYNINKDTYNESQGQVRPEVNISQIMFM